MISARSGSMHTRDVTQRMFVMEGISLSGSYQDPSVALCPSQARGTFPSTSASLSPFGCRPSRIASTMSGAKQVSGSSRQT
jgi:hypothetical protein